MGKPLTDEDAEWIMKMATKINEAGYRMHLITIEPNRTIKITLKDIHLGEDLDEQGILAPRLRMRNRGSHGRT